MSFILISADVAGDRFVWANEEVEFRVLEFSFGDGYEDSALVGSTEGHCHEADV